MSRGALSTLRNRLLGVALIVLVAAFFAVTILFYNKAFTSSVPITLDADSAGNQLAIDSDVEVRGELVGSVQSITSTGNGAVLKLSMDPGTINQIPANVTAELLPKTLFGETYVDLVIPDSPSSDHLSSGDVIGQDRSSTGIEIEQVLDNLLPVLQAVQPQKLSATLTAVATALQGRGPELGQTLDELNSYVGKLNPQLPTLEHDLSQLANVSNTYNKAAPDLINALNNLTGTSETVASEQNNLENLYSTLTTASDNLQNFLSANENNIIGVSTQSLPTLNVLARYSPEFKCFLTDMANLVPKVNKTFGVGTNQPGLHATIEITINRGPYEPGQDDPAYLDNRGPRCYDFNPQPNPFPEYPPDGPLKDGSTSPPAANTSDTGLLPPANSQTEMGNTTPQAATMGNTGLPNSPAEENFIAGILSAQAGGTDADIPNWSSLLVGPLFRGAEVTLK
ncbi:MAG TPA: MCE family protein [Pseudonocardiaceae bacterium]|jgi:virulence factor Mce-like protein|nr:MCE family protein [Pseudonocardiaceae bacterium]